MGLLDGKVAVITGGTRGLGMGIARAFVQNGAAVIIASRSQGSVDDAVRSLSAVGGQASGMAVDVAYLEQVEALAGFVMGQFGRLDIWVNNAGTAGPYGPTVGIAPDDFHQVIQTNILGVYHGSRTAMQYFLPQRSGKLINVLGHGYNQTVPWQNAYGSSKAWVYRFTKALAGETRGSGVGVYAYAPGMVLTELLTNLDVVEGSQDRLKVFPTIVRLLAKSPEVAAQKTVWIASPATDGKTGLLITLSSPWAMLGSALREVWRIAMRKPAPEAPIQVKVLPFYKSSG